MQSIKMNGRKPGTILLLVSVLFAMASSGCINQGTASGTGVMMENFEPDFAKIYADETFKLQAKVRNAGSVDARWVQIQLYNIGSIAGGQNFEIESCSSIECDNKCVTLLAPDPERGTIGESMTCIWNCRAPKSIPKGMSVTFNPSVRLYYVYDASTIKSVTLASQDELRAIQNQGKALPSETVSTTNGPVQLDVVVNGPIRYWQDERRIVFPININIQNTGGGTACAIPDTGSAQGASSSGTTRSCSGMDSADQYSSGETTTSCGTPSNWNMVTLYFENSADSQITLKGCEDLQTPGRIINLWKGQSSTITCEVDMGTPNLAAAGFVQKNLKFTIGYDYFTDASTSVEVVGRNA